MLDHRPENSSRAGSLGCALGLAGLGRRFIRERGAARACHWLVPLGLVVGLLYTAVYRAVWRQFGEVRSIALMPAVTVWLLDVGVLASLLYFGAARTARGVITASPAGAGAPHSRAGLDPVEQLALIVLVLLKLMLLIAIPHGISHWPGTGDWRSYFNWMYPHREYRPLILAPMWGRWAMLLVGSVGRPRDDDDRAMTLFSGSLSAGRVLAWMVPVAVLTSIYCGRRWMFGCIISCLVLAGCYLYGMIAARRQGGQTRDSILGAGLIGELVFLTAYEGLAANIYTP